jgi:prepilin signal peptidase PulO-like enzyme (type II secretory pathway)
MTDPLFVADSLFWPIIGLIAAPAMASFGMLMGDRWKPETPFGVYARAITTSHSICDSCAKPLSPLALLPIFGWLINHGRCQCRQQKVSWAYPLGELTALIVMAVALKFYGDAALALLPVIAGLAAAVRSDLAVREIHEIPTVLVAGGALGFWWATGHDGQTIMLAILIVLIMTGIYDMYRRRGLIAAIPLGDILIIAALAPLLGVDRGLTFFIVLPVAATVTKRLIAAEGTFPFAPAIAAATALSLIPMTIFTQRLDALLAAML